MHQDIKRFGMDGQIRDDSDIPRLREQFEHHVLTDMRASGYVPVLGLGSFWSTEFVENKGRYDFVLSIHGVHVGKKEACTIEGITVDGKMIPRTHPAKLKQSSETSE